MSGTEEGTEVVLETPEVEIEVVDDTPEQDRNRPKRPEGQKPYDVKDEEIAKYSESVQDRIKKLRYEFHEERRAKEQAQRESAEALRLAQQALSEQRRLQELAVRHEKMAVEAAKARAEAQMAAAARQAREAFEAGNTEQAINLQADVSRFAVERDRLAAYVPPEPRPVQQQAPQQPQQVQPQVQPDAKAVEWAKRNAWFGSDKEMTGAAYGIHESLLSEGIDPRSDEYYEKMDARIRRRFPENFEEDVTPPKKAAPVVAPANRTAKTPRKVTLTATQVALAKKFGLTVEQYAAEYLKANPNG